MMSCKVQISLDLHTIEDALYVADIAVQCGVDWLEAGTGLMVEQGLHVVTALRAKYPHHPIVCDFKVCDGASYFAKIAAAAGATHFDVMAAADVIRKVLGFETQFSRMDLEFALLVLHVAMLAALLAQHLVRTLHFGLESHALFLQPIQTRLLFVEFCLER
jgi:orotidine-5'-phosphate decarboxylase